MSSRNLHARLAIRILSASWLLTVGTIAVGCTMIFHGEWNIFMLYVASIAILGYLRLPCFKAIRQFMLDGIAIGVGGVTIIQTSKSVNSQQTLYGIHPHGLTSTGTGFALSEIESQTGVRVSLAVAPLLRWTNPIMRFVMASVGVDLISSDRSELVSVMDKRMPVGIVVGGFDEMLNTKPDRDTIFLKNRKGFIKLALRKGYSVTPVYCFGECILYQNALKLPSWVTRICVRYKVPAVVPIGKSFFDFAMPNVPSKGMLIVIGPTLKLPRIEKPTRGEIDIAHTKYMQTVSELYRQYNPYPDRPLEII